MAIGTRDKGTTLPTTFDTIYDGDKVGDSVKLKIKVNNLIAYADGAVS